MKIQLHHILLLTCFTTTAGVTSSFAQDSSINEYETVDTEREKVEKEKILYSPGEGDSRYTPKTIVSTNSKDSTTSVIPKAQPVISAKPKADPAQKEQTQRPTDKQHPPKDEDSILSFNFLYYIIQKYKLQDIID